MTDEDLEWLPLKAVRVLSNGKREFAGEDKERLARYCISAGASIMDMARRAGVNANLLRKWILRAQTPRAGDREAAFVAVAMPPLASTSSTLPKLLSATLPNGVTLELALRGHDALLLRDMIAALAGRA